MLTDKYLLSTICLHNLPKIHGRLARWLSNFKEIGVQPRHTVLIYKTAIFDIQLVIDGIASIKVADAGAELARALAIADNSERDV